jgi:hypothetical protein
MIKTIVVKTRAEGFHNWPDAPDEVAFLRANHRHEFHYELEIEVDHNDRELEFILVKRWLDSVIPRGELGHQSCEMIATAILEAAAKKYGVVRFISVGVFEDGENGAFVRQAL